MGANRDCLYCGERFESRTTRKLFCSNVCRVRYNREHELRCFYCGELGATRDHVFPHSARTNGDDRIFQGAETVNACGECNSLLGNKNAHFIEDRILDLIGALTKRYQLDRLVPDWDDEELEELGRGLRNAISYHIHQRQRAINRVVYATTVWRRVIMANKINSDELSEINS